MTTPDQPVKPATSRRKQRRRIALAQVRSFEKEDRKRAVRELKRSVPGLGVSLGLHLLIILVMALIVIHNQSDPSTMIELGWATTRVADDPEESAEEATIAIPSVSLSDREEAPARVTRPEPQTATRPAPEERPELKLADVSRSLSRRQSNRAGDGSDGGKPGTGREAIARALRWLARQQQGDGSWSLNGPYPDGGSIRTETGATALALLAFLGDGQTHQSGEYQTEIQRGLDWLKKAQRPNGDLFDDDEQGKEPHFYAHSQGTIALCEALALTGDETLREPAERAVRFLVDAQNPELGGWKYRPLTATGIGDLSVTGWVLMALHSARMAEIDVPFETFQLSERFLDSVQEHPANASQYKYRPDFPAEDSQRWSMTAEGLLCRQWLGWPKHHPAMRRGVEFLMAEKNRPEWKPRRRNVYAWYYTAQTLHNVGGSEWEEWFSHVLPLIVENQLTGGREQGSWHPLRPPGAFHERSRDAGRLYLTVMCVLILQTPDRHAPLYE